ncbi:unnamed protein product [Paramecium primaurelia]|uniref:Uncharacterized protein n=1 Tax=Paramecium primaurelia TaxID=5886 RepID=A0A8S1MEP1_PARPR|nr:unnamed protein product [Paramecium primaurelia]
MNSPFRISSARRSSGCKSECKQHFFTTNKLILKQPKDKEKLEETVIHLKLQINLLNDNNAKLRFEIQHLQKQLNKQEKALQMNKKLHIDSKMQTQQSDYTKAFNEEIFNISQQTCQIIAYSKQIKELENTIQQKNQQIEDLKRDTRKTRYTELQIQYEVIQKEYEELLKKYQALIHISQFASNDELNKDNIYLSKQLYDNQQLIQQLNNKVKKLETELHQSNFKRQQIERLIQEKEKELSLTHFEYSNPKKTIADLNKQWQQKLDLQLMSYQRQEQLLIYKQEQIAELEKKITDLEQQLQQKDFYHKKDIDNLHLVIATLKDQIFQLENEDKRKSLPVIDQPNESSERNKKHASVIINKKRIQKVNYHEISLMLLELQMKLKLNEIPFNRLDQYIYSKSVKGCLTLSDLIETFKQYPFELNDEQATLIARFIIEPEQEEWIYYDVNCTNDIVISISIFKNLIKPYELISYEENKVLYTQLRQIMKSNQNKIVSYLQLQGDHCNIQEFKKALDYNDVILSPKLDDLLMIKIYEQFKQLSKFKYSIIFDIFQ